MSSITPFNPVEAIGKLGDSVTGILDEIKVDDQERAKAREDILRVIGETKHATLAYLESTTASQRDVIVSEAKAESWLTRSWRPMIMCLFGYVIGWNYALAPLIEALLSIFVAFGWLPPGSATDAVPTQEIPPQMWTLLTVGIGGYIGSRGAEKLVKNLSTHTGGLDQLRGDRKDDRKDTKQRTKITRRFTKMARKHGWTQEELDRRIDEVLDT